MNKPPTYWNKAKKILARKDKVMAKLISKIMIYLIISKTSLIL